MTNVELLDKARIHLAASAAANGWAHAMRKNCGRMEDALFPCVTAESLDAVEQFLDYEHVVEVALMQLLDSESAWGPGDRGA